MTRYGHSGWRLVATVAFVGTAALAIVLTRVPIGSHVVSNIACSPSRLQAWLGLGATEAAQAPKAADGTYYALEFTNVSQHACSLDRYPEVSAYAVSQITGSSA